jgi:hypothetical protein
MKAKVEYGLARTLNMGNLTLNMGNFESTKVHVSVALEMDGKVSRQELDKTFGRIKAFVDEKVGEEEARWKL